MGTGRIDHDRRSIGDVIADDTTIGGMNVGSRTAEETELLDGLLSAR